MKVSDLLTRWWNSLNLRKESHMRGFEEANMISSVFKEPDLWLMLYLIRSPHQGAVGRSHEGSTPELQRTPAAFRISPPFNLSACLYPQSKQISYTGTAALYSSKVSLSPGNSKEILLHFNLPSAWVRTELRQGAWHSHLCISWLQKSSVVTRQCLGSSPLAKTVS